MWHLQLRSIHLCVRTIVALAAISCPLSGYGQPCSGPYCLEQQQVNCPSGTKTTITGTVYASNGTDPLPNVIVYIPNGPPDASGTGTFAEGVRCQPPATQPSGFPLTGTVSIYNGTYSIVDAPAGANIPIVIQAGKWRRQLNIRSVTACTQNTFDMRMPKNQSEGDIPKFAIVSGSADRLECVLRKVGIEDAEFTAPGGNGRIQLYSGLSSPGALVVPDSPNARVLTEDSSILSTYDVLMLACEGSAFASDKSAAMLSNVEAFANAGGRIFGSHFSYTWLYQNGTFANAVNWNPNQRFLDDQDGFINITFPDGKTLAQWLFLTGASTTYGQIPLKQLKVDTAGVVSPTKLWMTAGNAVMQLTFNMPWQKPTDQQCGRVLFSDYHIDPPLNESGKIFPTECSAGAMTPQEKLLEYNLFYLSGSDVAPYFSPDPVSYDRLTLGTESAAKTLTWTNSTPFGITVDTVAGSSDYVVKSDNCSTHNIPAKGTCTISVAFKPTDLGVRAGTVDLGYKNTFTSASLTGQGALQITASPASLNFGKLPVGGTTATQTVTVTNDSRYSIALSPIAITGDYTANSGCTDTIAAHSSCTVLVAFHPTATGARNGTMSVTPVDSDYIGSSVDLSGIGQDFDVSFNPANGDTIAGYPKSVRLSVDAIEGYTGTLHFSCTTDAVASTCKPAAESVTISGSSVMDIGITTTSKYTVIGYGGVGGGWLLTLVGAGAGLLLWIRQRGVLGLVRGTLFVLVMGAMGTGMIGCSGKSPEQNPVYTAPGEYTYTLTATDGSLTRSASYKLKVVASK